MRATETQRELSDIFLLKIQQQTLNSIQTFDDDATKEENKKAVFVSRLSKNYSALHVLDEINFDINPGEIFGLLGPNGAGKTTTMRILACLIRPSTGEALVQGMSVLDAKATKEIRRKVGLLTENPNVYERLTAEQNLKFFARAYGLKEELVEDRISEILRGFDLLSWKDRKTGTFSKGMKQKLAIARALIHKPSLLLLDEPTSGLDAESAKSLRELILETAKNYQHTVLLSTHNLDEASKLCDRIAILYKGRILAQGTENEIASSLRAFDNDDRSASEFKKLEPLKLQLELLEPGAFSVGKLTASVSGILEVVPYMNEHYGFEFSLDPKLSDLEVDLLISKIVSFIVGLGGEVTMVKLKKPALEDSYLKLVALSKKEERGGSS